MEKLATIFTDNVVSVLEGTKGRSGRLIKLRNEALCDRFYFYQKIHHYHFAKCVELLSRDYYISQIEVPKVIRSMSDYIIVLKQAPPSLRQLKEKHPQFNWDI